MAKGKTYEEKLFIDLQKLEPNKWYACKPAPEYDKFVQAIKSFINIGFQFEFSEDYKKVRLLSDTQRMIPVDFSHIPGYRTEDKACPPDKYGKQAKYREIFINEKLVSVKIL